MASEVEMLIGLATILTAKIKAAEKAQADLPEILDDLKTRVEQISASAEAFKTNGAIGPTLAALKDKLEEAEELADEVPSWPPPLVLVLVLMLVLVLVLPLPLPLPLLTLRADYREQRDSQARRLLRRA